MAGRNAKKPFILPGLRPPPRPPAFPFEPAEHPEEHGGQRHRKMDYRSGGNVFAQVFLAEDARAGDHQGELSGQFYKHER